MPDNPHGGFEYDSTVLAVYPTTGEVLTVRTPKERWNITQTGPYVEVEDAR